MAVGNRALSGPINIHCDHSDSMLVRDSGVVQLFAENAQEAYDLTVMAPRIAEHPDVLLPVLICQDGFTITHSAEPVALLDDADVARFVGDYEVPFPILDLEAVTSQGPFAMPDYYFELRRQQAAALVAAAEVLDEVGLEFEELTGRRYRALERYRLEDAQHALVLMGSTAGTAKDVVDELRSDGEQVGLTRIGSFRPFPAQELRSALRGVRSATVLDRADSPGSAAPLFAETAAALYGSGVELDGHVYGLGGRDLHPEDLRRVFGGGEPRYLGVRSLP
jgi:pyruvate ferredoxin oxidoreductase alpha subunit